jgi:tetratricopeptide (TPR) repeat protein
MDSFDHSLQLNQFYSPTHYSKGICLYELQQYEAAVICLDRALELNPFDHNAKLKKVKCLMEVEI